MKLARTPLVMALAAAVAATPAAAYYHYVHYLQTPYNTPVFEKFDLTQLPNKTVTFLVTDPGPAKLGVNDDFASVLSQVKQAAAVWNGVSSSDLRVAFGGEEASIQGAKGPGSSSVFNDLAPGVTGLGNAPGGDVVFADLPPGLLGMGGVTASTTPVTNSSGTFFPVIRSTMLLTNDTSQAPGPSYMESFFTTTVHEMGHALGLQHTFVGAAMSYSLIRNTSHARPIDLDDIAGLSVLYGNAAYAASVGSISGQVTSNGQPVAMASVVAITPAGPGISTLTRPDGTYRIDGLPPDRYWVYVHPLPPDANIRGPYDPTGKTIPWSGPFETLFYPGTRSPDQFGTVAVSLSAPVTGVNFSVGPRNAVPMYDITTYSYSAAGVPNAPALVNNNNAAVTIAAQAFGTDTPVPQSITVLGGFANPQFQPYNSPVALAIYLQLPPIPSTGPRHLVFNFANDMYVLPGGVTLVGKDPPVMSSVTPNGDGTVTVTGTNFGSDTRVYIDGLPAPQQTPLSGDSTQGSLTVTPPPGYSGQNASVIVYNLADGQNSTIYQTQSPPTYSYPVTGTPQISMAQSSLPAGVASIIDIVATNMQFVDGQITVGFGTSDIAVRRIWVLSPTHIVANALLAPGAVIGSTPVSLISGFQRVFQPSAFQIQAANPSLPLISLPLVNNDPNQPIIYPGAAVTLFGSNLGSSPAAIQLTIHGLSVPVASVAANQISFVVPLQMPLGATILTLNNGSATSPQIVVQIDAPPPVVTAITNSSSQAVDTNHPANAGDVIVATLTGVDPSVANNASRVQVTAGGAVMAVLQVTASSDQKSVQVAFMVGQPFGGASVPVVVAVDGVRSSPFSVVVN
ncbi:MAG TPA: IPT/TIG domain-containing protein [Bryobacteraceae bacterium]|nr:IPT/TIG domain-containing protein [Bryobacteraceae bacterium]